MTEKELQEADNFIRVLVSTGDRYAQHFVEAYQYLRKENKKLKKDLKFNQVNHPGCNCSACVGRS